jgi:PAS domain S-box-containing protein
MSITIDQHPAIDLNLLLSVAKDGTILNSNESGEALLKVWDVRVGEKLPLNIVDLVQRALSRNNPEKVEVKAGNRVYLFVFQPLPNQESVIISGFDISDQKEVEGKLREIGNKYRNIVETSAEGIWIFNAISETTYVNEKMAKMLGYNQEEIIGRFIWDFASEEDKGVLQVKLANRKLGIDEIYEIKLIHKDGSPLCLYVSTKGFFDDAGNFAGSVSMFTDITERKQVEKALQKSGEELARAQKISQIGSWTWDLITNEVTWSEQSYRNYGLSKGEVKPSYELFLSFIVPEDRERIDKEVRKSIESGHKYSVTYKITHRDGTPRILLSENEIVTYGSNKIIRMYGTNQDITERKQVEEKIQGTSNMLQLIMNNIPQGIFWKDRDSRYIGCNKVFAKAAGMESPENIVGKNDYDLPWLPEQTKLFREYDRRIMENDTPEYHIVELQLEADGELAWIETNKIPLHDAKGNVIGVLGTYENITKRKQMEEQTRQRVEELETLMDIVPVAIFIGHDPKCHNITGNKMANELYEAEFGENVSANISQLRRIFFKGHELTADELPMQKAAFKDVDIRNEELDLLLPSGEWRGLLGSASPLHDSEGNVRGSVGVFLDFTERKKAEAKLEETLENLEKLIKERTAELEKANESLKESKRSLAEAQEMAHIGNWEWDIATDKAYWSEEMYRIFKRNSQELPPSYKEYLSYIHPDDLEQYLNSTNNTRKISYSGFDFRIILASGEERTLHIKSEFIFNDENIPIRTKGIVQDITERKKVEDALIKAEIVRKQEIHHRIKNNLQVISSLLDLQAEKFRGRKNLEDSEVCEAFKESQDRVISMALIHEELHKGREIDTLNFSHYIKELADNLLLSYRFGKGIISLKTDIDKDIFFGMDTAVPLGIIINELVSNSLKHAFLERNDGEIRIKMHREENGECNTEACSNTFILGVSDNGIGIPENLDIKSLDSLGLQLVTILVEQLDGELELKRDNGTEFTIKFTVTVDNAQEPAVVSKLVEKN